MSPPPHHPQLCRIFWRRELVELLGAWYLAGAVWKVSWGAGKPVLTACPRPTSPG